MTRALWTDLGWTTAAAPLAAPGSGNSNCCPDAPLTRGPMAVFLAKALGLHWPG